jgi:hypothetical protein
MAKYLLLKHYRGAPTPVNDVPMDEWAPRRGRRPHAVHGGLRRQAPRDRRVRRRRSWSHPRAWVAYGGEGKPPVVDGPFAETKDLIAGWMIIDVDSWDRAVELAAELSAAPGAGGRPIHEWLEVRPFFEAPPTTFDWSA